MVIYGITYDHTTNYGSCFQAYALQKAVECLNINGEEFRYYLIPIRTFRDIPVKNKWKEFLVKPILNLHRRQFREFERIYMKYAGVTSLSNLYELNITGDAFVCGSDVIWNPDMNQGLGAYYLDFAEKYKFSYAASFGKASIDEKFYGDIRRKLEFFDSISVREKSGAEMLEKIMKRKIEVAADPVFLLTADQWNEIIPHPQRCEKYIFVYTTHLNKTILDFVENLRKQTELKVVWTVWGPKQALQKGILQVHKPDRWLQLLRDAEYVVTNSFHASAFSTIWHKKFFTVVWGEKSKGINIRMYDFLKYIGLSDRMYSDVPGTIEKEDIDYSEADRKITALRDESLCFLQENLKAAYMKKHKYCSVGDHFTLKYNVE